MRTIALVALALLLLGCPYSKKPNPIPKPEQKRYDFQDEAGSVLIGVQSVAPFEAYIDALQPRFNLTAEDALKTAVATTQIQELRNLRALLLSIAVNLPTQATAVSEELKRVGDETTSSRTETTTETSGAVPSASVPTKLTDVINQLSDVSTSVSLDASLNYRAAAALSQEVALLSSYVRDAAVGVRATPYVVRMLLTVFPSARRSPYDVYSTISFFGRRASEGERAGGPLIYNRSVDIPIETRHFLEPEIHACDGRPLKTIPLFVTDNLETSVLRSARGSLADLGGSVGGNIGLAGLGVGGRVQNESTAATLGRGLNALFTLGLASENTLAVRLGAVTLDTGYEMLPRTYNLTALVLVPSISIVDAHEAPEETVNRWINPGENMETYYNLRRVRLYDLLSNGATASDLLLPCTLVSFRAQSKFRDAESGSLLPSRDKESLSSELRDMGLDGNDFLTALLQDDYDLFAYVYRKREKEKTAEDVIRRNEERNEAPHIEVVKETGIPPLGDSPEYYWTSAVAARSRRGFAGGQFEVPRSIVRFFGNENKNVAIYDDGKMAYIQLAGGVGLTSKGISGQLTAKGKDKTWTVYSTNAIAINDGTGARIEFPSIQQATKSIGMELKDLDLNVSVSYSPPTQRWAPVSNTYLAWEQDQSPIVTIDPKVTPAAFSLIPSSSHIRANADGVGQIKLEVRATDKKTPVPEIRLAVDGGVVTNINPPEKADTGADIVLLTNKIYTVTIGNLLPGNSLKFKAWRMDGESKIEIPAIPVAVYEQEGNSPKKQ
jgi:hypothetical protein